MAALIHVLRCHERPPDGGHDFDAAPAMCWVGLDASPRGPKQKGAFSDPSPVPPGKDRRRPHLLCWRSRQDLNLQPQIRSLVLYPVELRDRCSRGEKVFAFGPRLHNPHLVSSIAARQLERLFCRTREPRLEVGGMGEQHRQRHRGRFRRRCRCSQAGSVAGSAPRRGRVPQPRVSSSARARRVCAGEVRGRCVQAGSVTLGKAGMTLGFAP